MTADVKETKVEAVLNKTTHLITNKQSRSVLLLIISLLFIIAINGILPVIEGQAHYTVEAVDMTYAEYQQAKVEDSNYRLTWISEQQIVLYKLNYIKNHPELTEDEQMLVEVPSTFKVQVYSKFFYEYVFWYISTLTSLGSAIILFYSLFNYMVTLSKDKYKRYVDLETEMTDMTAKYLDPVTFEPWMHDVFNRQRKIQQHKSNVKYDLDVLEKKTEYPIKKKLKPYFEALRIETETKQSETSSAKEILASLGKLSRKEQKYLNGKEKLLLLLDEAYIKEFVIDGYVKHFKYIYPMYVYNGQSEQGVTVDNYSMIKSDSKRISGDAFNKVLIALANTFLFAVLFTVTAVSSYQQEPFWIIVNVVSKLAPLMLQVPLAIDYSNVFMNTQLLTNLISRRSIGLLYLADIKKQGGAEYAKTN